MANEGRPFPVIISRGRTFAFLFPRYRGPVNIRLLFNVYLYLCVRPLGGIEGGRGEGEEKLLTPKQHESRLSTPEVDWSMIRGEGGEKLAVKAR